jgi:hypothetical protein
LPITVDLPKDFVAQMVEILKRPKPWLKALSLGLALAPFTAC